MRSATRTSKAAVSPVLVTRMTYVTVSPERGDSCGVANSSSGSLTPTRVSMPIAGGPSGGGGGGGTSSGGGSPGGVEPGGVPSGFVMVKFASLASDASVWPPELSASARRREAEEGGVDAGTFQAYPPEEGLRPEATTTGYVPPPSDE